MVLHRFILGCSGIAGLYQPCIESEAIIQESLNAGFTQFDTAPHYGLGLSEERMSKFAPRLDRIYTKVGRIVCRTQEADPTRIDKGNLPGITSVFPEASREFVGVFDYRADGVRRSFEQSKARLGVDFVFGLRVHDCERPESVEELLREDDGGLWELLRLRDAGACAHVSLGMNDAAFALSILRRAPMGAFDSILIAGAWNLIDQNGADLMRECWLRRVRVHNAGVFCSGALVGGVHYKYAACPPHIQAKVAKWAQLCADLDLPLPAAALAFALLPTAVGAVVLGVSSVRELREILAWIELIESKHAALQTLWRQAVEQGILHEHFLEGLIMNDND